MFLELYPYVINRRGCIKLNSDSQQDLGVMEDCILNSEGGWILISCLVVRVPLYSVQNVGRVVNENLYEASTCAICS